MIPPTLSPLFVYSFIYVAMGAITAFGVTSQDEESAQPVPSWTFLLSFFFWPVFIFVYFFLTLLTAVHKGLELANTLWIQKSYGKTSFWAILKDLSKDKK
jgi:hypothetical protein